MFTLFITTFTTVFLAELGDKTQLATLAISGSSNKPVAVFLGSSSALVLACLLAVLMGSTITRVLPTDYLKIFAAIGFIFIGLRLLWPLTQKIEDRPKDTQEILD